MRPRAPLAPRWLPVALGASLLVEVLVLFWLRWGA